MGITGLFDPKNIEPIYPLVLDAISDFIFLIDDNGYFIFANQSACHHFHINIKDDKKEASDFFSLWKGFLDEELKKAYAQVKKEKKKVCGKLDNEENYYEFCFTPVENENQTDSVVCIVKEITQYAIAEKTLETSANDGESQSTAQSDFFANMSHEIRTPINGIVGMNTMLLETELTREQKELADIIGTSAETLLALINDVLDFSKIEAGKLEITPVPFDLQNVFEKTVEMLAPKVREKWVEFGLHIDPEVPRYLLGDVVRIRQILLNLAGNAIKFTDEGFVLIRIKCDLEKEDKVNLKVSIQDTGIGIPKDRLSHIFSKFSQADSSTTRNFGGTGLGLAICLQLTELMGGSLTVDSIEGEGSTFTFTLPLTVDSKKDLESRQLREENRFQGLKALVVDDTELFRNIVCEHLRGWNIRVSSAGSSGEALDLLHADFEDDESYDLVVIDYNMQGIDGELLGRLIRSDSKLDNLKMVLLSIKDWRKEPENIIHENFDDILLKPFRKSMLHNTLSELFKPVEPDKPHYKELVESIDIDLPSFAKPEQVVTLPDNLRVLVMEDSPVNQIVIQKMLSNQGCTIDIAKDGAQGVKMWEKNSYDLIFMDVQMPEMNGFEATAFIRNSGEDNSDIPIIAMTGNATQEDKEKCLESGMDDYLSKPISKERVYQVMQRWGCQGTDDVEIQPEKDEQKPYEKYYGEPPVIDFEDSLPKPT